MAKKKVKPCFNVITEAYIEQLENCCGVTEVGNFKTKADAMAPEQEWNPFSYTYEDGAPKKQATKKEALKAIFDNRSHGFAIATTTPDQKDAVQALKATGFKKLCTTRSYEGNYDITIWTLKKTRTRKKSQPRKPPRKGERTYG